MVRFPRDKGVLQHLPPQDSHPCLLLTPTHPSGKSRQVGEVYRARTSQGQKKENCMLSAGSLASRKRRHKRPGFVLGGVFNLRSPDGVFSTVLDQGQPQPLPQLSSWQTCVYWNDLGDSVNPSLLGPVPGDLTQWIWGRADNLHFCQVP